jgi:hypothetical protein
MTDQKQSATADQGGPTWERLQGQIGWYDRNAKRNHAWFKTVKVAQIVLAGLVPVSAAGGTPRWVLGGLGAAVVVLEGIQQLFQFHRNWISYRATCEALRREQHLYQVGAANYATAASPLILLAERLEDLVSSETAEWSATERALQTRRASDESAAPRTAE